MAEALQIMRALHILFAITWAGAAIYRTHVVEHILEGEAADRFYAKGSHGPFMGISALGTVAFGGAILGLGDYSLDAMGTGSFVVLNTATTAATAAFLLGLLAHIPNDRHLKRLAGARLAGKGDGAEYARHRHRDRVLGRISMALIGLAMLGMVGFRLV